MDIKNEPGVSSRSFRYLCWPRH